MYEIVRIIIGILMLQLACGHQSYPSGKTGSNSLKDSTADRGDTVLQLDRSIWIVFQDSRSHYWFGSDGHGLYRYDGSTLLNYTMNQGLSSNRVRGIQEDNSGDLFISTLDGICRFDGHSFSAIPAVMSNDWNATSDDLWFSILGKDKDGGPYRFDGRTLHKLTLPRSGLEDEYFSGNPNRSFSPYDVYSIYKDRHGSVWFGTSNFGSCRFDGSSHCWFYEDHWTNTPQGGSFGIRSMIQDSTGTYWFSNTRYRYDIQAGGSTDCKKGNSTWRREAGIRDLTSPKGNDMIYFMSSIEDKNGDLWLVSYDQGVWRFNGTDVKRYPVMNDGLEITLFSIYEDRQGVLWLGTQNSGVYKFDGETFEKFEL